MPIINFLDLKAQYPLIKEEILTKFNDVMENAAFISGKYVQVFEDAFAAYNGVRHCVTASTGTDALHLALLALGIGRGDEVIVPANTFIATAEGVSLAGATPVFVDCDEKTYNIDPAKIEAVITVRTKAIIPVHLYGQCANMDPIMQIAKKHRLLVVEDACQAHGAEYQGRKAGSMGIAAAFSFYPGKNLGAWGEGGAVTTNDDALAEKMRLMRDHGSPKKYHHTVVGGNFRMNEFQGAVLSTKIKYLDGWNDRRRKNAKQYLKGLEKIPGLTTPQVLQGGTPIWHLFVIQVSDRDGLARHLQANDIQYGIHYPTPLHLTEAYRALGYGAGDFPVAEKAQRHILSLPMYAELTEEEIERVCRVIQGFMHSAGKVEDVGVTVKSVLASPKKNANV